MRRKRALLPRRHLHAPNIAGRRSADQSELKISVAILAGGQSSRMGKDKSRLVLDGRPLLAHVRAPAREIGLPVRVIRRDILPPCGPLSGIYTALRSSRADSELFLACDMPFVTAGLLRRLIRSVGLLDLACFVSANGVVGFPFLIRTPATPIVLRQIERGAQSLQALAEALRARRVMVRRAEQRILQNLNTPRDFAAASLRSKATNGARPARRRFQPDPN